MSVRRALSSRNVHKRNSLTLHANFVPKAQVFVEQHKLPGLTALSLTAVTTNVNFPHVYSKNTKL